jgi:hypothetical protein
MRPGRTGVKTDARHAQWTPAPPAPGVDDRTPPATAAMEQTVLRLAK